MGYIKYLGAMVLTMLFAVAIFGYVTNFGNDNDSQINLNDDDSITSTQSNIESEIINFKVQTNDSATAFDKITVAPGSDTTTSGVQFRGGITSSFSAVKQIISISYNKIFGSEQESSGLGIFLTTLIAFLAFIGFLWGWKTWAGKSPD